MAGYTYKPIVTEEDALALGEAAELNGDFCVTVWDNDVMPYMGRINNLPFSTMALVEGGVKFPLHPLLTECLVKWGVLTSQLAVNAYRTIMGVVALNNILNLDLGYDDLMRCMKVNLRKEKVYLSPRKDKEYLVTGLPDSSADKDRFLVYVGGPVIRDDDRYGQRVPRRLGKEVKQANYGFDDITPEQLERLEVVWDFEGQSAPQLLHYTPSYRHTKTKRRVALADRPQSRAYSTEAESSGGVEILEQDPAEEDNQFLESLHNRLTGGESTSGRAFFDRALGEDEFETFTRLTAEADEAEENMGQTGRKTLAQRQVEKNAAEKKTATNTSPSGSLPPSADKSKTPPKQPKTTEFARLPVGGKQKGKRSAEVDPDIQTSKAQKVIAPSSAPAAGGFVASARSGVPVPHPNLRSWAPVFKTPGDGRLVNRADSVRDERVTTALSLSFQLPEDKKWADEMGPSSSRHYGHKLLAQVRPKHFS